MAWLKSERNAICRHEKSVGRPISTAYTNANGMELHPICRDIGSDLQLMEHGIRQLQNLVAIRGFDALKSARATA